MKWFPLHRGSTLLWHRVVAGLSWSELRLQRCPAHYLPPTAFLPSGGTFDATRSRSIRRPSHARPDRPAPGQPAFAARPRVRPVRHALARPQGRHHVCRDRRPDGGHPYLLRLRRQGRVRQRGRVIHGLPRAGNRPRPAAALRGATWKPDSLGSGVRLGIDVPPWPGWEALLFSQASAFWQAPKPRASAVDWGAGGIISAVWVAPYFQVGRIREDRRGWYTTQMFAVAHSLLGADEDFGAGWHPTIAYQMPAPRRRRADVEGELRIFLSFGIERSPVIDRRDSDARHYWTRLFTAGVTVDARDLRDARLW
jgi:hypothetical protein